MAAISPSSSGVPPTSLAQPTTPPPSSQLAPIEQPIAIPPNPNSSFAQSPVPNNPPSSNSSDASSVSSPPPPLVVESSPPPTPSAPPPIPIVTQPPPINATPPQPPEVSSPPAPPVEPPVSSPPPAPPLSTPTPPSISPPTPPLSTPPPTNSPPPPPPPPLLSTPTPPSISPPTPPLSTPPPTSSPSPPPPSSPPPHVSTPPSNPPPPPHLSPNPPTSSPPSSRPPKNSPPPPSSSKPPRPTPPPPPPVSGPPPGSPPSSSHSTPPPSVRPPGPLAPVSSVSPSPPSPGSQTRVASPPPVLSSNSPPFNARPTTSSGVHSNGGIGSGGIVGIGVVVGVLLLGLIGLVAFCMFKRKKRSSRANGGLVIPASGDSSPRSDAKLFIKTEYPASLFGGSSNDTPTEHGGFGHSRSLFTYQELFEATSEFCDQNLLGEGGFGCVYKGILPDGRIVAVKQLKIGASQGEREFKAEVEIISRIHHRHLVSLVGYCISESKRLLVYEYVPNNTLHFHLHGEGADLDWAKRIKIAAGAARGIAYLHEDCQPRIIHRDIKSSNILLDDNFVARVSDFGLAKLAMDADTHVSTRVMGTFGYMAPEYATSGKLTEKSDVYSFGVVLLELITGRKPVDVLQPLGDEGLVEWARPLLTHALDTGELRGLVDPRLENNYIESQIYLMIEAAAACVRHSAAKRPRMGQVVRAFDGISDSGDLSNGLRVGESQLYDSAQQSAEIRWFRRMAFGSQGISTDFFSQPTHNPTGFSTQSENNNFPSRQRQTGNLSRYPSQDAQNLGFSGQSGQNVNFSARQGQSGNFSRHPSQDAQNLGSSGQSGHVNLSAHQGQNGNFTRHSSQDAQNQGFTARSGGEDVNLSGHHGRSGNFTRQQSVDAQNQDFSGQSAKNVNLSARCGQSGNVTRQQSVDAQNPSFLGPSRQNVYSSAQHDFDDDISR